MTNTERQGMTRSLTVLIETYADRIGYNARRLGIRATWTPRGLGWIATATRTPCMAEHINGVCVLHPEQAGLAHAADGGDIAIEAYGDDPVLAFEELERILAKVGR